MAVKGAWYTVWNAKTDEILAFGDGPTCAKMMGIKYPSFLTIVSRVVKGKNKNLVVQKELVNEMEEDNGLRAENASGDAVLRRA